VDKWNVENLVEKYGTMASRSGAQQDEASARSSSACTQTTGKRQGTAWENSPDTEQADAHDQNQRMGSKQKKPCAYTPDPNDLEMRQPQN